MLSSLDQTGLFEVEVYLHVLWYELEVKSTSTNDMTIMKLIQYLKARGSTLSGGLEFVKQLKKNIILHKKITMQGLYYTDYR